MDCAETISLEQLWCSSAGAGSVAAAWIDARPVDQRFQVAEPDGPVDCGDIVECLQHTQPLLKRACRLAKTAVTEGDGATGQRVQLALELAAGSRRQRRAERSQLIQHGRQPGAERGILHPQARKKIGGGRGMHAYLVPKMRSPASPRPGTM